MTDEERETALSYWTYWIGLTKDERKQEARAMAEYSAEADD